MNRSARPVIAILVSGALTLGWLTVAACSSQEEGEVCSTLNGNDDCDTNSNLYCAPSSSLNNSTSDRCCPLDRTTAAHPACKTATAVGTSADAAGTPADTGPAPSTTADAQVTSDAAPDATDQ